MEFSPTSYGASLLTYSGDDYIVSWNGRSVSLSTTEASKEKTTLTVSSAVTPSDDGKYFVMADTVGNNYVVYIAYDSDSDGSPDSNGVVPDPGLDNQIMVPVVVQADTATISDVVADLVAAIDNLDNFAATDSDPDVVIENSNAGKVHAPVSDGDGDGLWVVVRDRVGYDKGEVIKTNLPWMAATEIHNVEASMDGSAVDLTAIVKKKARTVYINEDRPSQQKKEVYMLDKETQEDWFTFNH